MTETTEQMIQTTYTVTFSTHKKNSDSFHIHVILGHHFLSLTYSHRQTFHHHIIIRSFRIGRIISIRESHTLQQLSEWSFHQVVRNVKRMWLIEPKRVQPIRFENAK